MKRFKLLFLNGIFILFCTVFYGQNIAIFKQYNGRFDFTFVGNTLNTTENNNVSGQPAPPCTILTTSSAFLNLGNNDLIENAYLYWAGSGSGDFDVKLNGENITAERRFNIRNGAGLIYFSAFTDITERVQVTGNGLYTFSDLDLTAVIPSYCATGGNFGGWAILVVYKNNALPLNQLNVYDGMQSIPTSITISLNNLSVIDTLGAKIGFIAWEGDKNIAVEESLRINGILIGNPPLNPLTNAFNGTNSITGASDLYNMDLDVYDIQNAIHVGDTSAQIQLTSGQDFVMLNTIVTKLNSQLPDATIAIQNTTKECASRNITVAYSVFNYNCTNPLPSGTPIAIYANGILVKQTQTTQVIAIGGTENNTVSILIPETIGTNFELKFVVDDTGFGVGIVTELFENNNSDATPIVLDIPKILAPLPALVSCNIGLTKGRFNFANYQTDLQQNPTDTVTFFVSMTDLENETNAISNASNYEAISTPIPIYCRVDYGSCYDIATFLLTTKACPPVVYNYISPNNDGENDTFKIDGLRDVFMNFKLSIFNRWGKLVWSGNNSSADFDGYANDGLVISATILPEGTYFYSIELDDSDYPKPLVGYLYLSR